MTDFVTNAIGYIICMALGVFIGVVINAVATWAPEGAPAIYILYGIIVGKFIWTK